MTIRIVLVDDHAVVRDGLAAVFAHLDGFEVVGQAATGYEAVERVRDLSPDVVLMDVRMPGLDGVEATRQVKSLAPECAVLMLTMYDDDATVFGAMKAGAQGYLLKDAGPSGSRGGSSSRSGRPGRLRSRDRQQDARLLRPRHCARPVDLPLP